MNLLLTQFEFASPQRLSALAIVLVVLLAGMFSLSRHRPSRRLGMAVCRALAVGALVLAWAGLVWRGTTTETFVVLADDRSDSASEKASEPPLAIGHGARLPFAGETGSAAKAIQPGEMATEERQQLGPLSSDLARAVCRAAALVPEERVGHIVLHSDGRETLEGLLAAAAAQGIPMHAVVKPSFSEPEVCIAEVVAPQSTRPLVPFDVEVVVTANRAGKGQLELHSGDKTPESRAVELTAGTNRFQFTSSLEKDQKFTTLRAVLAGFQDTYPANNVRRAVVTAAAKPQVLVVMDSSSVTVLIAVLSRKGCEVTSSTAEQLPVEPTALARYDAVILADTAAQRIAKPQQESLKRFVEEGGGLIAWGGQRMLSPPALAGSWLEKLLPLAAAEARAPRRQTLALVLIIDKSRSMLDEGRLNMAKEAARRTVNLDVIGADDQVGVLAFGDESQWISPLAPSGDKQKLLAAIDTLEAAGATNMAPAMQRARLALMESTADRRHVILLSDGVSSPGDFDRIAREMAAAGITVSTVSVSQGADQTILRDIARVAGGRHYHCDDPKEVPRILEQETRSSTQPREAASFRPLVYRALPGLDVATAPNVSAYVPMNPKPGAELVLITPGGDPLLAWWNAGRGKVVAVATDLAGPAAAEWQGWNGYGSFLERLVRQVLPTREPLFRVTTQRRFERLQVIAEMLHPEQQPQHAAELAMVYQDSSGKRTSPKLQAMRALGGGKYVGEIAAADLGIYHLRIRLGSNAEPRFQQQLAVTVDYPDELKLGPPEESLLAEAAKASGGEILKSPVSGIPADSRTVQRRVRLGVPLVMAAMVLLMAELVLRRWKQMATMLSPPAGSAAWCDRPMGVP